MPICQSAEPSPSRRRLRPPSAPALSSGAPAQQSKTARGAGARRHNRGRGRRNAGAAKAARGRPPRGKRRCHDAPRVEALSSRTGEGTCSTRHRLGSSARWSAHSQELHRRCPDSSPPAASSASRRGGPASPPPHRLPGSSDPERPPRGRVEAGLRTTRPRARPAGVPPLFAPRRRSLPQGIPLQDRYRQPKACPFPPCAFRRR
mmetsp:Transcript_56423/g.175031  ORF Transcript_56423/g.175031 Transcript_56423/m.175031 type:complete len:204 (-) Transcript_56423:656-1267(-)